MSEMIIGPYIIHNTILLQCCVIIGIVGILLMSNWYIVGACIVLALVMWLNGIVRMNNKKIDL